MCSNALVCFVVFGSVSSVCLVLFDVCFVCAFVLPVECLGVFFLTVVFCVSRFLSLLEAARYVIVASFHIDCFSCLSCICWLAGLLACLRACLFV